MNVVWCERVVPLGSDAPPLLQVKPELPPTKMAPVRVGVARFPRVLGADAGNTRARVRFHRAGSGVAEWTGQIRRPLTGTDLGSALRSPACLWGTLDR